MSTRACEAPKYRRLVGSPPLRIRRRSARVGALAVGVGPCQFARLQPGGHQQLEHG